MAKTHEISVYFSTNAIVGLCHFEIQNALVSKGRMLLSWKVVNRILWQLAKIRLE